MVNKPSLMDTVGAEISSKSASSTIKDDEPEKYHSFSFRVSDSKAQEYKEWCMRHRMKLVEGFTEGFKLLRDKYGE